MTTIPNPTITESFDVTAYDESWGGYGDNRSMSFTSKDEAIKYSQKLIKQKFSMRPVITHRIVMQPINIRVDYSDE